MYIRLGPSDTLHKTNCCIGPGLWGTSENAENANFAEYPLSVIGRKRCLEIAPLPLLLKIAVNSHSGGWTDKRGPSPGSTSHLRSHITTEGTAMSRVRVHNFSISLDGFGTGDGLSLEAPFGHAGHRLHEWMIATRFWDAAGTAGVDNAFAERHEHGIGAEIMGAGKFGPPGWQDDPEWRGWWGPNPPFHTPTYVLTHRPRPPLEMDGGTTFHFLDVGLVDALAVARGGQTVRTSASVG